MTVVPSGAAVALRGSPVFDDMLTALAQAKAMVIVEIERDQWAFPTAGFHEGFVEFTRRCRPETFR